MRPGLAALVISLALALALAAAPGGPEGVPDLMLEARRAGAVVEAMRGSALDLTLGRAVRVGDCVVSASGEGLPVPLPWGVVRVSGDC
ncbi:MAG: hypothetical protein DRO06_03005 [Thermoproteota archaeon]|nr:MAG: hypothetical protein DRO06_03005 [Candidatus Korarchaeota archaeon]